MISVCIATYNGAKYIKKQVDSILAQLDAEDEVIISDDASKDSTVEILQAYHDPKIKIIKGPCKGHPRYNFENALKHTSGDYIFLSDQDDEWLEGKVERMMTSLQENDLVVSNAYVVDGNNSIIKDYYYALEQYPMKHNFLHTLLWPNYLGCCLAFKRIVLDYALPFPQQIAQHDIWLGLCADAFKMRIEFIPDRLMNYKRYGDNFSPMGKSIYPVWKRVWFRMYFLYCIIVRYVKMEWIKK